MEGENINIEYRPKLAHPGQPAAHSTQKQAGCMLPPA